MPLLRKTLHDLRWHIVGYGGGLGMLAALYVVLYPAFAGTFADFELPEAYSAFIGDVSDLAAPRGFFQIEFFSFWMPLLVAVYAVVVSTGLLAGDEQRGTLEMMLAQPVSRRRLFVERVAAFAIGATLICALASLGFVVSAPFIDLRGDVAVWELGLAPFAALPLALACGSLGLLAGALSPTRGLATGLVAAETVTVYFFDVLADLIGPLEPLRYLSPFFYSDAKRVLVEGAVPWHAAVLLGAFVLLTALALAAFEAREIGTGHSPLRALLRRKRRAAVRA